MSALIVLVPVLRRPQNVRPLLDSLRRTTPDPYRVLFIPDLDDSAERGEIQAQGAEELAFGGSYAQKINHGVQLTDEPLIFLGADDLRFHPGWLEAARAKLHGDGIGVVGTNDLCNPRTKGHQDEIRPDGRLDGQHSTHSLVARWYVERGTADTPGQLLHEGYQHEFVDDEFVATARARGAYAHAPDSIVEHLHPDVGKAPMDDVYEGRRRRMRQGRQVYEQRRHMWT